MISELCQLVRGEQNLWIKININISEPIILRQVPLEHWGECRRFKRFPRPEKIFPILASKCSPWSISIISLWYNNFTIQNLRDIPFFLSIKVCWKVWTFFCNSLRIYLLWSNCPGPYPDWYESYLYYKEVSKNSPKISFYHSSYRVIFQSGLL